MKRVAVLGSSGMLGSTVLRYLQDTHSYTTEGFYRGNFNINDLSPLHNFDVIVNCIGVIKPMIDEGDADSVRNAYDVNSWFPRELAHASYMFQNRVIQIATDCVYSGDTLSDYTERDVHDATDVYGRSKSMGEVIHPHVRNIRCSIIGPEESGRVRSLLEWLMTNRGGQVTVYTNHLWNGITTLGFARVCQGLIDDHDLWAHLPIDTPIHLHPAGNVNKLDLLRMLSKAYKLEIDVQEGTGPYTVNRTITSSHEEMIAALWYPAYGTTPSIEHLIEEMAEWT